MYLLIGMLVSFVSLFLTALTGSLLHKKNLKFRVIAGGVCAVIYGLVLWPIFWGDQIGIYGPTPFLGSIIIGAIIGASIASITLDNDYFHWKGIIPGSVVIGGYLIYLLIGVLCISQSDMLNSKSQAELIGDVKIVNNVSELIKPADNAHICQVSVEIATTSAQNALSKFVLKDGAIAGSRYVIGKPTKEFVDKSYWWVFPLEFDGWQKWKQDTQVPGYLRVSAENPSEQPQAVQVDKLGNEIHIKYLNSACFEFNAQRYLREHGFLTAILEDWTYEVDDNWRPYYTVSVIERTMGFQGKKVKGIITLDLQTGEIQPYDKDALKWIDRIIPLDVIDYNAEKWGEYSVAGWWYNVWHNDKSQKPTPGWFLTYNGEECQWFSGFTSMNDKDKALTGFILSDARTGKSSFFKTTGVTEDVAYDAAKAMWNNLPGYTPTELVPYNIYSYLTYVIPMKCNNQFSGISLVSLNNINVKAKGDTLEEALRNYRDAIMIADSNGLAPQSGEVKSVELSGIVEFVGPVITAKSPVTSFKLKDIGKIFQASYSDANPKILLLKEGQSVKITYSETTEVVVTVTKFDIPSVLLEKGSVTQGKYINNNETTNKEVKRIDDQGKVNDLVNSDAIKNVDPAALQKFLDEQKAKSAK